MHALQAQRVRLGGPSAVAVQWPRRLACVWVREVVPVHDLGPAAVACTGGVRRWGGLKATLASPTVHRVSGVHRL